MQQGAHGNLQGLRIRAYSEAENLFVTNHVGGVSYFGRGTIRHG